MPETKDRLRRKIRNATESAADRLRSSVGAAIRVAAKQAAHFHRVHGVPKRKAVRCGVRTVLRAVREERI